MRVRRCSARSCEGDLSFRSVDTVLRLEILVAVEEKTRCDFQMTRISDSAATSDRVEPNLSQLFPPNGASFPLFKPFYHLNPIPSNRNSAPLPYGIAPFLNCARLASTPATNHTRFCIKITNYCHPIDPAEFHLVDE